MAQQPPGTGEPAERPAQPAAGAQPEARARITEPATVAKVAVGLFLLVLFVLFVIQNADPVLVNFVFFKAQIRLIWVFVGCAIIGGIIAWLIGRPRRRAMRRLIQELDRQRRERR